MRQLINRNGTKLDVIGRLRLFNPRSLNEYRHMIRLLNDSLSDEKTYSGRQSVIHIIQSKINKLSSELIYLQNNDSVIVNKSQKDIYDALHNAIIVENKLQSKSLITLSKELNISYSIAIRFYVPIIKKAKVLCK
jgi:hypothetical protein